MAKVDDRIGSPAFAISLIASPTDQTRASLCAIQDLVADTLPDTVYRCPGYSLHLSVFQFVYSRKSKPSHQMPIWNKLCENAGIQLQSITNESQACFLESLDMQVSDSAVIVQFAPSRDIELLRDRLEPIVRQSKLAWNRPAIQHVTLYRYTQPFRLSPIAGILSAIDLPNVTWKIDSLDLVQESCYPSLQNKLIQSYSLG